jgi:AcrR family transcriptional regulator
VKIRNKLPALALMTIGVCSSASIFAMDKTEYIEAVMDIFRRQVTLLQDLATSPRFKYSDNLVRSASAIERTFGLLGPMEWHAVQAATIRSEYHGTAAEINEELFEDLARASRRSMTNLVRTAHDVMEYQDPESILAAISEMKQSCNNCHSLLPKSVAPDLWGPLPRK